MAASTDNQAKAAARYAQRETTTVGRVINNITDGLTGLGNRVAIEIDIQLGVRPASERREYAKAGADHRADKAAWRQANPIGGRASIDPVAPVAATAPAASSSALQIAATPAQVTDTLEAFKQTAAAKQAAYAAARLSYTEGFLTADRKLALAAPSQSQRDASRSVAVIAQAPAQGQPVAQRQQLALPGPKMAAG